MNIEIAPTSPFTMTYNEAVMYCFLCTHAGHKDWRLPSVNEWLHNTNIYGWTAHRASPSYEYLYAVTPVRVSLPPTFVNI